MRDTPKPYRDLKILGLAADQGGCGNYRIRLPLRTLEMGGASAYVAECFRQGFTLERFPIKEFDFILFQRESRPEIIRMAVEAKQKYGTTLIYEVDDQLHRVHRESAAFRNFKPTSQHLHNIDRAIEAMDGMIVTTKELAGEYSGRYGKPIWVIPNNIDFHIRAWDAPVVRPEFLRDKLIIGWAGSHTHQEDQEPLRGVLAEVLEKYPHVWFNCCSSPQMAQYFVQRLQLPKTKTIIMQPVPFDKFPLVPKMFDIGLAPLKDSTFNRCKSDLKLKEYGAVGVPYVAQDIAPYRQFHKQSKGVGGLLASRPADWKEAMETIIESDSLRQVMGDQLRDYVRTECNMQTSIDTWAAAFRECRAGYQTRIWESREKPGRNSPCPCGSGLKVKRCCKEAFG
jgi:glycosyltransferase involved in cell wall biosynthesis